MLKICSATMVDHYPYAPGAHNHQQRGFRELFYGDTSSRHSSVAMVKERPILLHLMYTLSYRPWKACDNVLAKNKWSNIRLLVLMLTLLFLLQIFHMPFI